VTSLRYVGVFSFASDSFVSPPTHRLLLSFVLSSQVMGLPMHRTSRQITIAISDILELVNR
jgi:hypothetical protein